MSAFQLYPLTSVGAAGAAMPATAPVVCVVTGESLSEDGLRVPAGRLLQKKAGPRWAQDQRAGTQRACSILEVQRARKSP
jgi:hypothetical protein